MEYKPLWPKTLILVFFRILCKNLKIINSLRYLNKFILIHPLLIIAGDPILNPTVIITNISLGIIFLLAAILTCFNILSILAPSIEVLFKLSKRDDYQFLLRLMYIHISLVL